MRGRAPVVMAIIAFGASVGCSYAAYPIVAPPTAAGDVVRCPRERADAPDKDLAGAVVLGAGAVVAAALGGHYLLKDDANLFGRVNYMAGGIALLCGAAVGAVAAVWFGASAAHGYRAERVCRERRPAPASAPAARGPLF